LTRKIRAQDFKQVLYRLKIAMLLSVFLILASIKATLTGIFSV